LALLDTLGRRYSCRPSAILRGRMTDFHIDLAACLAGLEKADAATGENANQIEW
jgi:hypothetical protein